MASFSLNSPGVLQGLELLQPSQYWYEEEVITGRKAKLKNHKETNPLIQPYLIIANLLDFLNYVILYISSFWREFELGFLLLVAKSFLSL